MVTLTFLYKVASSKIPYKCSFVGDGISELSDH